MPYRITTLLLFSFTILLSYHASSERTMDDLLTPKQRTLSKLVDLILDPRDTENMRKDFLLKIQTGLSLSNRAIFDEMLTESGSSNKEKLIRDYEKIENQMNRELASVFAKKVNFHEMIKSINMEVYGHFYTNEELVRLYRFYASPLGQKFLRTSKAMIDETQLRSTKLLYPLSMDITKEVQEVIQRKVLKLFEDDLQTSWD